MLQEKQYIIRYGNRPSFLLLVGAAIGYALYILKIGSPLYWILGAGTLLIGNYIIRCHSYAHLLLLGAWSLTVALYTHSYDAAHFLGDDSYTINNIEVKIDYPLYDKCVAAEFSKQKVLLHLSPQDSLPESQLYSIQGRATFDLVPLTTLSPQDGNWWHTHLRAQGFVGEGYLHTPITLVHSQEEPNILTILRQWRSQVISLFEDKAKDLVQPTHRALLYALSLGEKGELPRDVQRTFNTAGVAHILVVSGYHLGVVYSVVLVLLSWLLRSYRWRHLRHLLLASALIGYALFTGAASSTLRALLMALLLLVYKMLDRKGDSLQILFLAVLLLFCYRPHILLSGGLLLSVSAVWGIVSFYPFYVQLLKPRSRLLSWSYSLLIVSASAQLGVLPWLLYLFNEAGISFIWSNLPITFLSLVLIPLTLIVLVLLTIGVPLPTLVFTLLDHLAMMMQQSSEVISQYAPAPLHLSLPLASVPLYYVILYLIHSFIVRHYFRAKRV